MKNISKKKQKRKNLYNLIKEYEEEVSELWEEIEYAEENEYEPAPSGETNDYYIKTDSLYDEISTMNRVIRDIKLILYKR